MWKFSTADGSTVAVRVDGPLQTNSAEVVRASVLTGLGIGYSPVWLFEDTLAKGEVQALLPDWPTRPLPIHLVSPPQRRHAAKVRAFGEHLAGALGG